MITVGTGVGKGYCTYSFIKIFGVVLKELVFTSEVWSTLLSKAELGVERKQYEGEVAGRGGGHVLAHGPPLKLLAWRATGPRDNYRFDSMYFREKFQPSFSAALIAHSNSGSSIETRKPPRYASARGPFAARFPNWRPCTK